jgi:hypothetical protein
MFTPDCVAVESPRIVAPPPSERKRLAGTIVPDASSLAGG